jgi:hypothetical protein
MRAPSHDRLIRKTVLALVALSGMACGSVTSPGNDGGGHGGTTGAAGTQGTGGSAGTAGQAGTSGNAGTSGGGGRGGTTGSAGTGGATGSGGTGGTQVCAALCTTGRMCCGGGCVNPQNDPFNCGKCGNVCPASAPFCGAGTCQQPTCGPAVDCAANATCCGNMCCSAGQICCDSQGPVSGVPTCFTPTPDQKTCPQGCAPLCVSDRNAKKNIAPADTREILDKVARLPISTWTYNEEPSAVRHLGPMAQDFRASFGLGTDDRTYNAVDAHGVALAAIQALERIVAVQEKRIEKLERENRQLEQRLTNPDPDRRPARTPIRSGAERGGTAH